MLPIEQQVTNFQMSMRLKELGVPQNESYFVWKEYSCSSGEIYLSSIVESRYYNRRILSLSILCDAFTLSELMNMFPEQEGEDVLSIERLSSRYRSGYSIKEIDETQELPNCIDSLGLLLINCIELLNAQTER